MQGSTPHTAWSLHVNLIDVLIAHVHLLYTYIDEIDDSFGKNLDLVSISVKKGYCDIWALSRRVVEKGIIAFGRGTLQPVLYMPYRYDLIL